jgi:hypothetical protein
MSKTLFRRLLYIVNLLILVSVAVVPLQASAQIAVTGVWSIGSSSPVTTTSSLALFIEQVKNGSAQQITGLYVENLLSFPVIQQPSDQPAYVSPSANLVTQFQSASAFGSLGFIAHNNLAGIKFPEIKNGDLISVVYGDGYYTQYQVTQIRRFQAVQPNNPYSSFIDLSNNQMLTVQQAFYQTYGVSSQLILQTCISSQGLDTWGRLFVIAAPYTPAAFKIAIPSIFATIE